MCHCVTVWIFLSVYEDHDKCHFKTESYRNMSYNDDELWFIKKKFRLKEIFVCGHTKGLKMSKKKKQNLEHWKMRFTAPSKTKSEICGNMNIYFTSNQIDKSHSTYIFHFRCYIIIKYLSWTDAKLFSISIYSKCSYSLWYDEIAE